MALIGAASVALQSLCPAPPCAALRVRAALCLCRSAGSALTSDAASDISGKLSRGGHLASVVEVAAVIGRQRQT